VTCRDVTEFIMDYLSGQLETDVVAAFEAHLVRCEACRRFLASYQATISLERSAFDPAQPEAVDVPEDLVRGILEARRR
jgi:anti-sigma factor RsiW